MTTAEKNRTLPAAGETWKRKNRDDRPFTLVTGAEEASRPLEEFLVIFEKE